MLFKVLVAKLSSSGAGSRLHRVLLYLFLTVPLLMTDECPGFMSRPLGFGLPFSILLTRSTSATVQELGNNLTGHAQSSRLQKGSQGLQI